MSSLRHLLGFILVLSSYGQVLQKNEVSEIADIDLPFCQLVGIEFKDDYVKGWANIMCFGNPVSRKHLAKELKNTTYFRITIEDKKEEFNIEMKLAGYEYEAELSLNLAPAKKQCLLKEPPMVASFIPTSEVTVPGTKKMLCHDSKFKYYLTNTFGSDSSNCISLTEVHSIIKCAAEQSVDPNMCMFVVGEIDEDSENYKNKNMVKLTIKTGTKQVVSIASDSAVLIKKCNKVCSVEIMQSDTLTVTCQNGKTIQLKKPKELVLNCDYKTPYVNHVLRKVCQEVAKPSHFWLFFVWLFTGRFILILFSTFYDLLYAMLRKLTMRCKRKFIYGLNSACELCGQTIDFEEQIKMHDSCVVHRCPYCDVSVGRALLKEHVGNCKSKLSSDQVVIKMVEDRLDNPNFLIRGFNNFIKSNKFQYSMWIVVTIFLFFVLITPVSMTGMAERVGFEDASLTAFMTFPTDDNETTTTTKMPTTTPTIIEEVPNHPNSSLFSPGLNISDEIWYSNGNKYLLERIFGFTRPSVISQRSKEDERNNFADLIRDVRLCESPCEWIYDKCFCESSHYSRSLKSDVIPIATNQQIMETSWGPINLNKHKPNSFTTRDLSLTWVSEEEDGDSIVLSGKSHSVMKLEPFTSLVWTMQHKKSNEKRKLVISIVEFSQNYIITNDYWTADRKIETFMHGTCTGGCPGQCNCKSKSCIIREWQRDRDWSCNPTWCLSINDGCTCCAAEASMATSDIIGSVWTTDYVSTEIVVCVSVEEGKQTCKSATDNSEIKIKEFGKVQFTEIRGQEKVLPQRIAVIDSKLNLHKIALGTGKYNTPKHIGTASEYCTKMKCQHGQPGDTQAKSFMELVGSGDITTAYGDITLNRKCNFGGWPTCDFPVKERNTAAFVELIKTVKDVRTDFTLHKLEADINKNTLLILGRPKAKTGSIDFLIDITGFKLKLKTVKPIMKTMSISNCKGCYNCVKGFECTLTLELDYPESFTVHIKTENSDYIVSDASYIAEKTPKNYKIHCFSQFKISKIKLCLEEIPDKCHDTEVEVVEEKLYMQEHSTIIERQEHVNRQCLGIHYFTCLAGNVKNFFGTLGTLYEGFIEIWKVVMVFVAIGLALYVVVVYGPRAYRLCCGKRSLINTTKFGDSYRRRLNIMKEKANEIKNDFRNKYDKSRKEI